LGIIAGPLGFYYIAFDQIDKNLVNPGGRPSTTWIHQICRDTGVTVTPQLAEDRPFWQTIVTAGGFGYKHKLSKNAALYLHYLYHSSRYKNIKSWMFR